MDYYLEVRLAEELTEARQALTCFDFLDVPLKSFEIVEVAKLSEGQSLSKNHLRLVCVVATNIEIVRNGLQIHHHVRERIFALMQHILERQVTQRVVVSEATKIAVEGESVK